MIRQMGVSLHGDPRTQRFSNLTFWSLHAYRYHATLIAGDQQVTIEPGTVTVLMPGEDLEYRYRGPSEHAYVHFLPVKVAAARRPIGIVHRLGTAFDRFDADFREAIGWFPHETPRARARVWDLLWRLAEPARGKASDGTRTPPVLSRALEMIELTIASGLPISRLADELDISPAHLARLFNQYLGVSPLQYVLRRRVERAEHLLRHTTLPIKAVAREIGIQDLQQFNKLIRQRTGHPPRKLRSTQ